MEYQESLRPTLEDKQPTDRLEQLGPAYVSGLAEEAIFMDSEEARLQRKLLYNGLPKNLEPQETDRLSDYIGIAKQASADPEGPPIPRRQIVAYQIRVLKWLGSFTSNEKGNEATSRSISHTLLHNHGLRGKRAAISLWYERNIQN